MHLLYYSQKSIQFDVASSALHLLHLVLRVAYRREIMIDIFAYCFNSYYEFSSLFGMTNAQFRFFMSYEISSFQFVHDYQLCQICEDG